MRGVAGCGSRTQGATRSSAISVGDIPERPHRHARRRPLRAHQRPRQRRQTTDPPPRTGHPGTGTTCSRSTSSPNLPRPTDQHQLRARGRRVGLRLAGRRLPSAGRRAGGRRLVVTAAPHPRGTATRRVRTSGGPLCCQSSITRLRPANSWTRVCLLTTRTNPSLPGAARGFRRIAVPVSELCDGIAVENPADD